MHNQRVVWTATLAALLIMLALTGAVDRLGSHNTEQALVRALATYALARALNGVISVAQGTEVAIEPAGVGLTLTPGEILDPINDLVERFSWVMLVSSASLGVLDVLLSISAWLWLSLAMALVLLALIFVQWRSSMTSLTVITVVKKLAIMLIILRFAAPLVAIANDLIYQEFLAPRYESAIAGLEMTTERISDVNKDITGPEQAADVDSSILDKAMQLYESTADTISANMDMEARMQRYQQAASEASRHTIDLIVIFAIQTILLPIVFILLIWHLLKWVIVGHIRRQ